MGVKRGYTYNFDAWGPDYWRVCHAVTFMYPETNPKASDKRVIINFFELLPFILPCAACGIHLHATFKDLPLDDTVLESRDSLTRWLVKVHNIVNTRKGKPTANYVDVYKFYQQDDTHPVAGRRRAVAAATTDDADAVWAITTFIIAFAIVVLCLRR
jgi:hypothetical protein